MENSGKNSNIFDAASDGDLETVKYLVTQKEDSVNSTLADGSTPLMKASANGHFNLVKYLVEKGADVNATDKWGYSALLWSADYHIAGLNVISYLVEHKANIEAKDKEKGYSTLHWAAKNGDVEIVKYLVEKGARAEEKSREGETPFHLAAANNRINVLQYFVNERGVRFDIFEAAEKGYTGAVKYFIERKKKKSDLVDQNGWSVLHRAAYGGNIETVKYLVEKAGSDVNAMNTRNKTPGTPLHAAAERGHVNVVTYLVQRGADIDARDVSGRTALYWASSSGHLGLVEHMIDILNGDPSATDSNGSTLLHAACRSGNLELVRFLIETKHANLNAPDKDGRTPLIESIQRANLHIFEYLITQTNPSVNVKVVDKNGNNVVHYLADKGYISAIRELSDRGVDFDLRNYKGQTPLDLAAIAGHFETVKYLIDGLGVRSDEDILSAAKKGYLGLVKYLIEVKGADINTMDSEGSTPLYFATAGPEKSKYFGAGGHLNVLRYLVDEKNGDVHQRNPEGYTLLHVAAMSGPLEIVKYLVEEKGLDVNAVDNEEFTPLFDSIYANKLDTFKYLLEERSANVGIMTLWGTCLHEAATRGYLDVVKALVNKGADIESRDSSGHTPVYYAANGKKKNSGGHIDVLRYLVDEKKANVYQRDLEGNTLLHAAAMSGPLEVVKYLVEEKALDVNAKDKAGYTVLYDAIYEGKFDIFLYLVEEKSADFRSNTPEGTCLHLAATWGYIDFVKTLTNKGADMNAKDVEGRTPIFNAADGKKQGAGGHLDVLRYFLDEKKVDAAQRDKKGNTLLHAVSMSGPLEVFKYLVAEKGLDVNAKNNEGFTVLFNSVSANKFTIFKYLLEETLIDPRISTSNGTCLHEAARKGYIDFVKILVEKGVDVNAKDKNGRTATFYAAIGRNRNVQQYLESKGGRKNRRRREVTSSNEPSTTTNSAYRHYSAINYVAHYGQNFAANLLFFAPQTSHAARVNPNAMQLESNFGFLNGLLLFLKIGYGKLFNVNVFRGAELENTFLKSEMASSPAQSIEGRMDANAVAAVHRLPVFTDT